MMSRLLVILVLVVGLVGIQASQSSARDNATALSNPLLRITDLTSGGNEVAIELDLAGLEALETTEIVTSTLWTDGVHRFEGVPLRSLLNDFDLNGRNLRAVAINDYMVEIPLDDILTESAILAYRMNGAPMSRRAKGPLWIIYPFDESPKFRTETIYARSIWQLNRIELID